MNIDCESLGCAFWVVAPASIVLLFIDLRYALFAGITAVALMVSAGILGRIEKARQKRRDEERRQREKAEEEQRNAAAARKRELDKALAAEEHHDIIKQIADYLSYHIDGVAEMARTVIAHGLSAPQQITAQTAMRASATAMLTIVAKANGQVNDGLARLFYAVLAETEPTKAREVEYCKELITYNFDKDYKVCLPPDITALALYDRIEGTSRASVGANIYYKLLLKASSMCVDSYALKSVTTAYIEALRPYLSEGSALGHQKPILSVSANQKAGLDAVAGMKELKERLTGDVIEVFRNPERYQRYGISIPNGVLLFGPPGCGKTYIARHLASELAYHFVEVSPSDVGSSYLHGTTLNIRKTFEEASQRAPSVLFLDEFDALVPSREQMGDGHQYRAEEVNEFLARMGSCAEQRILLIAATNRPWEIDPAIQRAGRLDKKIYVAPPDSVARREILEHHLTGRYTAADLNVEAIAPELLGYASSDLKLLVDEAAKVALKESEPISVRHLIVARRLVPPSISAEQEAEYRRFGTRGMEESPISSPKVGFNT